tara:strand:- start:449 stop:1420 length:972 start_codon:yes stop_codon:yes gene_type:complete
MGDTCENKYLLWSSQLKNRGLGLTKQDCLNVEGKTTHQKNEKRKNCRNDKLRKASIKKAIRERRCSDEDECTGSLRKMVNWLGEGKNPQSELDAEYELCIAAAKQPVRRPLTIPFQTWVEMVDRFFETGDKPLGFLTEEKIKWQNYKKLNGDRGKSIVELCQGEGSRFIDIYKKPYSAYEVAGQKVFGGETCFSYEEFRIANLNEKKEELHYYVIDNGSGGYMIVEKASYDNEMSDKIIKSFIVIIEDGFDALDTHSDTSGETSEPSSTGGKEGKSGGKRKSRKRTRRRRKRKKYSKKSNRKLKKKSRKRKRKKRTRRRRRRR